MVVRPVFVGMGAQYSAIQRGSLISGAWSAHVTSPLMDQYRPDKDRGRMARSSLL